MAEWISGREARRACATTVIVRKASLYLFSLSLFYQGDVADLKEAEVLLRALVLQTMNGPKALIHTDPAEAELWQEQKRLFLQRRNLEL